MPVADVLEAVQDHIDRAKGYDTARDYENGEHHYPYASDAFKGKFEWILKSARANACYTVRSNFTDLVQIQAWSGAGAKKANDLAETTDLDMVIDLTVNESWRCGDGYILVWPGKDGRLRPWYHRADQVAFKRDPEDPDAFLWLAKLWVDRDGFGHVSVYYTDQVERWVTRNKIRDSTGAAPSWIVGEGEYVQKDDEDGPAISYSTVGVSGMPWIHLPFDASEQGGHGRSILRDVIPLQDGLNHAVHAIVVNTEQYAAPLRSLMNYAPDISIDPKTGEPTKAQLEYDETRNKIFGVKGPGPLTQHDPPNSENILAVKRDWHTDIANTVGIPVSDVVPDLGNIPSGAALRVLAARRTATVRTYNRSIRGRLAQLMALLGVPDAYPEFIDPAPQDDTERIANAQAKLDMGYPLSEVLPELGEDADDIVRILAAADAENQRAVDAFRASQQQPGVMGVGDQ